MIYMLLFHIHNIYIISLQVRGTVTESRLKQEALLSGFPMVLDDVDFDTDMKRRIMHFYTGAGEADNNANYSINSGLMFSSNKVISADVERLVHFLIYLNIISRNYNNYFLLAVRCKSYIGQ